MIDYYEHFGFAFNTQLKRSLPQKKTYEAYNRSIQCFNKIKQTVKESHAIAWNLAIYLLTSLLFLPITFHIHKPAHWYYCDHERNWTPICKQRYGRTIPAKHHLWSALYGSPRIPDQIIQCSNDWEDSQNVPSPLVNFAFILVNRSHGFVSAIIRTKQCCSLLEGFPLVHCDCEAKRQANYKVSLSLCVWKGFLIFRKGFSSAVSGFLHRILGPDRRPKYSFKMRKHALLYLEQRKPFFLSLWNNLNTELHLKGKEKISSEGNFLLYRRRVHSIYIVMWSPFRKDSAGEDRVRI